MCYEVALNFGTALNCYSLVPMDARGSCTTLKKNLLRYMY